MYEEENSIVLTEKCFICKNESEKIFSFSDKIYNENVTLLHMLMDCTSLNITINDEVSDRICMNCVSNLWSSYNFKKQCLSANQSLENIDNRNKNPLKKVDEHEIYCCSVCKRNFSTSEKLYKHSNVHFIENNFECLECEKQFSSQNYLDKHKNAHQSKEFYKCKVCTEHFISIGQFKKHFKNKHLNYLKCQRCNFETEDMKKLTNHVANCTNDSPFFCRVCDQKYIKFNSKHNHTTITLNDGFIIIENFDENLLIEDSSDSDLSSDEQIEKIESPKIVNKKNKKRKNCFSCNQCSEQFDDNELLVLHLNKHKNKSFTCKECNQTFKKSITLKRHLLSHTESKNLKKLIEEALSEDNSIDVMHFLEIKKENDDDSDLSNKEVIQDEESSDAKTKFRCRWCKKIFFAKHQCLTHELKHEKNNEIDCVVCGMKFLKITIFEQHYKAVHMKEKKKKKGNNIKKPKIVKKSKSPVDLKDDIEKKLEDVEIKQEVDDSFDILTCDLCEKQFLTTHLLLTHEISDHPEREIKCDQCDRIFLRQTNFLAHKKAIHGNPEQNLKITVSADQSVYECMVCNDICTTLKDFKMHQKKIHNIKYIHTKKEKPSGSKRRPLKIPKSDSGLFKCEKCPMEFRMKDHWRMHNKRHHGGEEVKKYLCTICGKKFLINNELETHIRRHLGEKPFKCQFCDKTFASKFEVRVHTKYHTGERNHECSVCGYRFVRAYSLRIHMRKHTGERPYRCEYCSSTFAQRNDWKKHTRRHTGDLYRCEVCIEQNKLHGEEDPSNAPGFLELSQLRRHKLIVHNIDVKSNIRRMQAHERVYKENHKMVYLTVDKNIETKKEIKEIDELQIHENQNNITYILIPE